MTFQWNALRVGNRVLVHDAANPDLRMVAGTVVIVQPRRGSNDIGIRVVPLGERARVARPRRLAVHLRPYDPTEPCWRCDLKRAVVTTRPRAMFPPLGRRHDPAAGRNINGSLARHVASAPPTGPPPSREARGIRAQEGASEGHTQEAREVDQGEARSEAGEEGTPAIRPMTRRQTFRR